MSKAILIMNMPKCCLECPCCVLDDGDWFCQKEGKYVEKAKMPSWCPLKKFPEKKTLSGSKTTTELYKVGYNAAIDEILGKDV